MMARGLGVTRVGYYVWKHRRSRPYAGASPRGKRHRLFRAYHRDFRLA